MEGGSIDKYLFLSYNNMKNIYTIGYSAFKTVEDFINILKKYNINVLVDVRSNPYSEYYFDYNKENLEKSLKKEKIFYRNYQKEFGARQTDEKFFRNGVLDFELFRKSDIFLAGVEKIETGLKKNFIVVFMCAEKDPATCHRNIMVAKAFYDRGYNIQNILFDGTLESQEELEKRLLKEEDPCHQQIKMFEPMRTYKEKVEDAYRKRNQKIGCILGEEEGEY